MLAADGAVVGAEQPALGEAEHQVDRGEAQGGVAPGGAEIERLVVVAGGGEAGIAGPAVGRNGRGRRHGGGEKARQAAGGDIGHDGEPQPSQAAAPRITLMAFR